MTYVAQVNGAIRDRLARSGPVVCFGQNITKGSCLSGLTRGIDGTARIEAIDTPNCENAMVAMGFGMMLEGVNSIFFVKQLDFLLLTLDQLANTWNMARQTGATGSFTIVAIVVDSGFEGPQSRLNTLYDFCSMADMPAYVIGAGPAAAPIVDTHLVRPGVRILATSQRLFRVADNDVTATPIGSNAGAFQLCTGDDVTIAAFNFAWPQARGLAASLSDEGIGADVIALADARCGPGDANLDLVMASAYRTGRLIIVDDSRSLNRPGDRLRAAVSESGLDVRVRQFVRTGTADDIRPHADAFEVDTHACLRWIAEPARHAERAV